MKAEGNFWHGLGRKLPALGFGGWQIAGVHDINGRPNGWGEVSESRAVDLVVEAIAAGIRFFDTAQGYGAGCSETRLGHALASSQGGHDAVICTKIPIPDVVQAQPVGELLPWLSAAIDSSRQRLRRDVIDIVLLHNPPDGMVIETFREAFDILVGRGALRTYGVSARTVAGARRYVDAGFGTCIQWNYSILERRPETALFPMLDGRRMNFIARSPLYRGLLTERFLNHEGTAGFGMDDIRSTLDAGLLDWVDRMARRVRDEGRPRMPDISAFALSYVLSQPQVSCAIPGISGAAHLRAALVAWELADRSRPDAYNLPEGLDAHYPFF